MKRQFWPSTFLILGLCLAPAAFADADAEREALAKIIHEINALESRSDKLDQDVVQGVCAGSDPETASDE